MTYTRAHPSRTAPEHLVTQAATPQPLIQDCNTARTIPDATGPRAWIEASKPGITRLVTMTSLAGFVPVALEQQRPLASFAWDFAACAAGTALSAAGANAVNQVMERRRDALMDRTRTRPIPSGRARASHILAFGAACCIAGVALLWSLLGAAPALVSLACIVSYLALYTPLKPVTPLATFVGALPGALPPLIGASAASSLPGFSSIREPAGLALFALMFAWQIPHFLAIAWLYKDDYAKGGYAVLPVLDDCGRGTAWTIGLWTGAIFPASLLPVVAMPGLLGAPYAIVALLSTSAFAYFALRLLLDRSRSRARALFFASIIHLPVLLIAMTGETLLRGLA
jgi:protoheme IX farnesyltransferase